MLNKKLKKNKLNTNKNKNLKEKIESENIIKKRDFLSTMLRQPNAL